MISVILTTVNRFDSLIKAIGAILEQSYSNFEIIVSDDGSTDNTPNVMSYFNDARVHYVRLEKNQGYLKNFNNGLENCAGEYVITLSDDDRICDSRYFEHAMSVFNGAEDIDIVFGRHKTITPDGDILSSFPFKKEYRGRAFFLEWKNMSDHLNFSTFIFKRELLKKAKVFQTDIPYVYTADWSAIIKTALLSRRIIFYDSYVYAWTKTSDQQLSGSRRGKLIEEMFNYLSFPHDIIELNEEYQIIDDHMLQSWCNQQVVYLNSAILSNYHLSHSQEIFKQFVEKHTFKGKQIFIYGYGDLGILLSRYLKNNHIDICGFIDDFREDKRVIALEKFRTIASFPVQVILATFKYEFAYAMLNKIRDIPEVEIIDLFPTEII